MLTFRLRTLCPLASLVLIGCGSSTPPATGPNGPVADVVAPGRTTPVGPAVAAGGPNINAILAKYNGYASTPSSDNPAGDTQINFRANGPKEDDVAGLARDLAATGKPISFYLTSRPKPDLSPAAYTRLLEMNNLYRLAANGDNLVEALKTFTGTPAVKHLQLTGVTAVDLSVFAKCTTLESLIVSGSAITGEGVDTLANVPTLRAFSIGGPALSAANLAGVSQLTQLTGLGVQGDALTDADVAPVAGLTGLKTITVSGKQITPAVVRYFTKMSNLEAFTVSGDAYKNVAYTDDDLKNIGQLDHVSKLKFSGSKLTDEGYAHIGGMKGLKSIVLDSTGKLGPKGMAAITSLPHLETLHFSDRAPGADACASLASAPALKSFGAMGGSGDEILAGLGRNPHVERIVLYTYKLTDAGLKSLAAATSLREFSASGAVLVSDAGLAGLTGLGNLKELKLESAEHSPTKITDAGVDDLLKVRSLESLGLENSAVTDAGVARLVGLPKLQTLFIANTAVTDKVIDDLAKFPALKVVNFRGTKVSSAGAAKLKAARGNKINVGGV